MKVLVIGSGAREHAIISALLADDTVTEVVAAPGNAGIAQLVATHPVDVTSAASVAELAGDVAADLVVIGPEVPLVAGAADAVRALGIACFGPSAAAAQLEGSKAFAKQVMAEAGVPTSMAHVCTTIDEVGAALDQFGPPYVVKDDGLAAGKGVVVTSDRAEAIAHARSCLAKGQRRAGRRRGVPRRSRGVAVRDHRRDDGAAAPARPGLQARGRGRRRPEHRRHGRVLAAAVGAAHPRRRRHRAGAAADGRRHAPPRARRSPACCTPGWR